jgi:hypothetical protein
MLTNGGLRTRRSPSNNRDLTAARELRDEIRHDMSSTRRAWHPLHTLHFAEVSSSAFALPARLLAPFRIANAYGLFAVMTEARYEIEFQGSRDGTTWIVYPFRYKPQNVDERPGIYAPYQPRFEWNLWFASLEPWQASPWVVAAQQRLVEGSPSVLRLFRNDPFNGKPPALVRTVLWQYWFTDRETQRRTGAWWRRTQLGMFTGVVGDTTTAHR